MSVRYNNCRLELLADAKGAYGAALVGEDNPAGRDDMRIVLRPDKVNKHSPHDLASILQPIPRHLRRYFRRAGEARIADHFFTVLLAKAGLERYSRDRIWWADTKTDQDKNRQKYHTLQTKALDVTNFQMRQVLDNCPQDVLKASRRFRPLILRCPRWSHMRDYHAHYFNKLLIKMVNSLIDFRLMVKVALK